MARRLRLRLEQYYENQPDWHSVAKRWIRAAIFRAAIDRTGLGSASSRPSFRVPAESRDWALLWLEVLNQHEVAATLVVLIEQDVTRVG